MTDKEALKKMYQLLLTEPHAPTVCLQLEAIAREALVQPEQEPVAWGVFEGNLHDMFFTLEEAQEMARLKGSHAEAKPLYTYPPQRKPSHKEFMEWAGKEGYDTAYTINSDNGKFIALSPMTADLWKAWQAAHSIKENT